MIRMLKPAKYGGKEYKPDEEHSVEEHIERFWIKNGIAEKIEPGLFEEQPMQSKFDAMSDQQLEDYAYDRGIDISRVKSREAAIAKLQKYEQ